MCQTGINSKSMLFTTNYKFKTDFALTLGSLTKYILLHWPLRDTCVIFVSAKSAVQLLWSLGQSVPLGCWKHFHQSKENSAGWLIISQQHDEILNSAAMWRALQESKATRHSFGKGTYRCTQLILFWAGNRPYTNSCYPTSGVGSHVCHLLKGIQEGHSSQNSGSRWTENTHYFRWNGIMIQLYLMSPSFSRICILYVQVLHR